MSNISIFGSGGGGGGSLTLSDGTTTVTGVTNIDVIGGTVGGTTPDATLTINARPLATSDLSFFVSPTGNDSNPGTIGQPFKTISHAMNVAASFDYVSLWSPSIFVADGTYNETIDLPSLVACPFGPFESVSPTGDYPKLIGNEATPTNVILNSGDGNFNVVHNGQSTAWLISGFASRGAGNTDVYASPKTDIGIDAWDFGGTSILISPDFWAGISSGPNNFPWTVSSSSFQNFMLINNFAVGGTPSSVVFSNSPTCDQVFSVEAEGQALLNATTFTGTVTGQSFFLQPGAQIFPLGGYTTLPGSTPSTMQLGSIFVDGTGSPVVAQLPVLDATAGAVSFVTDALSPVSGSPVVGGGAVVVSVFWNGADWIVTSAVGGSGSPGGTDSAVQFNNAGSFGGDASQFSWDKTDGTLSISSSVDDILVLQSSSNNTASLVLDATATGGHNFQFFATANGNGSGGGLFGVFDATANGSWFIVDGNNNGNFRVARDAVFAWSSDPGNFAGADTGIGRIGGGVLEVNTGVLVSLGGSYGDLFVLDLFTNDSSFALRSGVTMNNGAATNLGTITNAPSAGNPTKWLPYDDNGTTRFIPAW